MGDALGEQLWEHRRELRAVARRRLWDAAAADDVAQETLLRAICAGEKIDPARRGAWLTAVGRRLAIDQSRQQQRVETRAEPIDRPGCDDDPALLVEHREQLEQVVAAIGRLNPRQRTLLLRQVAHGLSLDQLAADEHTTVASVRSVLARARDALRTNLAETGWLVAGSAGRLLTAAENAASRVLARVVPVPPAHNAADSVTAVVAVVSVLFGPTAGPASPVEVAAPAVAAVSTVVPPVEPRSETALADRLLDAMPTEVLDTATTSPQHLLDDDQGTVVPFSETEGEIVQFAVAPDQQTVLAHGGWTETEASKRDESPVKEWEATLYRSEDGGRTWTLVRRSGFVPGRVLFAPAWPADPRVFVVTDGGVVQSIDGGRTYEHLAPVAQGNVEGVDRPSAMVRDARRPPTVSLRPAVLSPRFAEGEERIYIGDPVQVFDIRLGVAEPVVSAPPWVRDRGVAAAPDYSKSGAVLVGATVRDGATEERAALFRCARRQCTEVRRFEDVSEPLGVFSAADGVVVTWTTYAVYRSADGGRTWERQNVGPVLDLVEVGGRLVFLSLSGVPVSDDRGQTWRGLRLLYSISAVAPIGRDGLLLAAGPGMACSPDRGETWHATCA